uniref:Ribosomal protein S3 n=2 Tax=Fusarium tricinctum species complex TaxID=679429 RepID=A0A6M3W944_9HYPO|nr:ribosomal protein S3 [Fusarium tricinctum]CDL73441.1 Small ribosomal protein 3 n1 TaxGibberella zeae PH-1 RepIDA5J030_GIBZE [Fusarium acuminatum CS5907]CDX63551.1 Small ribosomal protein 3 n1 TaxGibberella zeae PH-1 RepIDA5J030_GIBZE [Fusarium acuminatum CS5907]
MNKDGNVVSSKGASVQRENFVHASQKIYNNNLKRSGAPKTILLKKKIGDIGITKYLPSFSKEWKNTIYSYNKNTLKNIPVNDLNINKIIKGYFNLYFKDRKYTGSKFILLKRRRNLLRRIHVSNAEIKHTNNKAIITLYTLNREKNVLKKKYLKINKKISKKLIAKRYFLLYKENIEKIYKILGEYKDQGANVVPSIFISDIIRKTKFIKYKLEYLNKFIKLKDLYLKKVWGVILNQYARKYLKYLRKYDLLYSLNQYKFNRLVFLPILSNILNKIIGKKIEYNIINLKSVAYHTDLFTNALALKLRKRRINYIKSMFSILNRAYLPNINTIKERSLIKGDQKMDLFQGKFKDLKIISNMGELAPSSAQSSSLSKLLDGAYSSDINNGVIHSKDANKENIHNTIYNSIGYKNMAGIRLEVKGRLTKRYRADRSIYSLKWKGGLKNVDSSFRGLSSVLFRGNSKSNVTYSIAKSKRRIGAFAVKGWIGGK